LGSLPRIEAGRQPARLIFTTNGHSAVSGFSRAKAGFDKAIDAAAGAPVPHWTLHDLRRTAASGMAGLGIAPHVVEAALNHKSGSIKGVAAVYNRYNYSVEKRTALEAWSRYLDTVVNGAPAANVVEFARK
jgi:integrase